MAGSFQIIVRSGKNTLKNQSEEVKNKLIEWGWYLYTLGVILGAFQAKITVGYFWTWDLKEIFSLLTILGYLLYIIIEMKWNKRVKQFLILISLILAIITIIVPAIAYSYHNPFTLF